MKKLEYLDTAKWQYQSKLYRNVKRFYIAIDQEPKSKKSISKEEIVFFQEQVLKWLKARKKRNFRKGIALFISFETTSHTAPHIQTLAKNYIDLLWANKTTDNSRKYLLFKDDNQIDILIVWHHKSNDKWWIHIKAQAIWDFIKDLNLLHRIRYWYFTDYNDNYSCKYERDSDDNNYQLRDSMGDIQWLNKNKDYFIKKRWIDEFNRMKDYYVWEYQKKGLNNYFSLDVLMDLFKEHFTDSLREKRVKEIWNKKWLWFYDIEDTLVQMILKESFSLNVWKLPNKDWDSKILEQQIDSGLKQLLEKRPFLKNLRVPLKMTLIVTQPSNKYSNKDLDNIMRDYIIPKVIEKFDLKIIGAYEVINLKPKKKAYLEPWEMRLFLSESSHWWDNVWIELDGKINDRENSLDRY